MTLLFGALAGASRWTVKQERTQCKRKTITPLQVERLKNKLIRMAYDLEYDAARVRSADDRLANALKDLSSALGRVGRS